MCGRHGPPRCRQGCRAGSTEACKRLGKGGRFARAGNGVLRFYGCFRVSLARRRAIQYEECGCNHSTGVQGAKTRAVRCTIGASLRAQARLVRAPPHKTCTGDCSVARSDSMGVFLSPLPIGRQFSTRNVVVITAQSQWAVHRGMVCGGAHRMQTSSSTQLCNRQGSSCALPWRKRSLPVEHTRGHALGLDAG